MANDMLGAVFGSSHGGWRGVTGGWDSLVLCRSLFFSGCGSMSFSALARFPQV